MADRGPAANRGNRGRPRRVRRAHEGPPRRPQRPSTTAAPNPGTATVGVPFLYNATAADPDGDPLTFDLPVHPAGMAVDPALGVVAWQPTPDQAGATADVLLRVSDGRGGVALQSFQVKAVAADNPPVITSAPATAASAGLAYRYAVLAQDPDGDPLSYALSAPQGSALPAGMAVDARGVITWAPPATGYPASVAVVVTVGDGRGGSVAQPFTITVTAPAADRPPALAPIPNGAVGIGQPYFYQAQGSDPDGDPLTYSCATCRNVGRLKG